MVTDSERPGRRRKAATVLAMVSLAVSAAAPGPPGWAQEPTPRCRLHQEGTGDNGTVAYEIPALQPEGIGFDPRDCSFYTAGSFFRGEVYRGTLDQPRAALFLPPEHDRHSGFGIEVDPGRDLLLVAGGQTGVLFAYDVGGKRLHGRFDTGPGGFLNEVTVAPNGDVYVTDSGRPFLYRIKASAIEAGGGSAEAIPLGPDVAYGPGFNANGVVATPDGEHLIFATTNSGKLYRVTPTADPHRRDITEITVDQGAQTGADGLEIDEHTIYLVRNQDDVVVKLTLTEDYTEAQVASQTHDPLFRTPTSVALAPDGRLLIGIAEYFNSDGPPYHVVSIRRP